MNFLRLRQKEKFLFQSKFTDFYAITNPHSTENQSEDEVKTNQTDINTILVDM